MNNYLIFRTDRIGDFLITSILINSIKRNENNSHITLIVSEKNYDYVKSFEFVDKIILLKKGLLERIKLISFLIKKNYKSIIIHDQKNRSKFISFFLRSNLKILPSINSDESYIFGIKNILKKLDFDFIENDLNTLNNRSYDYSINLKNFVMLHFDEKWLKNTYIESYVCIEPIKSEFVSLLIDIVKKTSKKLVVTSGLVKNNLFDDIKNLKINENIIFLNNLTFLQIESLINDTDLLISCHGATSHVAAAKNKKQIDIIEKKKYLFYRKWTYHFRNYNYIYRKKFSDLSKDLLKLL
tara:strand:+ start:1277 stop:2167 length:891 start_codon:yes stop_codon:yes gene_type:complete